MSSARRLGVALIAAGTILLVANGYKDRRFAVASHDRLHPCEGCSEAIPPDRETEPPNLGET